MAWQNHQKLAEMSRQGGTQVDQACFYLEIPKGIDVQVFVTELGSADEAYPVEGIPLIDERNTLKKKGFVLVCPSNFASHLDKTVNLNG